ncbi:MAG TPA: hypothetical protein VGN60_13415 [Devosia sp.]|jgi:hypothetical protein|nr:hypothetical protein [Devosia sp.]
MKTILLFSTSVLLAVSAVPSYAQDASATTSTTIESEGVLDSAVTRAELTVDADADTDAADTAPGSYGAAIAAVTGWAEVDLDAIASASDVTIVPLTSLQGGSTEDEETLETALAAHAMAKGEVHAAAQSNAAISEKLEAEGFAIDNVVALRQASDGGVTVYVDDRA